MSSVVAFRGASRTTLAAMADRRRYVTESKPDQARVETAIKLDKKDFAGVPPPSLESTSDIKVSPMAGTLPRKLTPYHNSACKLTNLDRSA